MVDLYKAVRMRKHLGSVIILLLVGCQAVSGLSALEADGKHRPDAGIPTAGRDGDTGAGRESSDASVASGGRAGSTGSAGSADMTEDDPDEAQGAAGSGSKPRAGAGGASARAGAGGHGGAGGATGATGAAGAAGSAPLACTAPSDDGERCDNNPQCGCSSAENCVFFPDNGDKLRLACRAAGKKQLYQACDVKSQDCERGYQCLDGLCQRPCEEHSATCANPGSRCVQGVDAQGLPVGGLYLCSQTCNPLDAAQDDDTFHSCGPNHVCQIAPFDDSWYTYCRSGTRNTAGVTGRSCKQDTDCAESHFCSKAGFCQRWCKVGGSDCVEGQTCAGLSKPLTLGGFELGQCTCPGAQAGKGACDVLHQCGCLAGEKCDVVVSDGTTACMPAGTAWYGETCAGPADCLRGATCLYGTCHALCDPNASDGCGAAKCSVYETSDGVRYPEYAVCRGGFAGTCTNIVLTQPAILSAECLRADETTLVPISLDLATIISNVDGALVPRPPGDFASVCQDINLVLGTNSAVLTANCRTFSQALVPASLELNHYISNVDGRLVAN